MDAWKGKSGQDESCSSLYEWAKELSACRQGKRSRKKHFVYLAPKAAIFGLTSRESSEGKILVTVLSEIMVGKLVNIACEQRKLWLGIELDSNFKAKNFIRKV